MAPERTRAAADAARGRRGPGSRRDLVRAQSSDAARRPGRPRPTPLAAARDHWARATGMARTCAHPIGSLNAVQLRSARHRPTFRPTDAPRGGAMQRRWSVLTIAVAVAAVAVVALLGITGGGTVAAPPGSTTVGATTGGSDQGEAD